MSKPDDAVVEAVARALNLNFKAQFDGRPIPDTGLYDPTDWTATGKELDLTEMAGAAIHAYRQAMRERGVVEEKDCMIKCPECGFADRLKNCTIV